MMRSLLEAGKKMGRKRLTVFAGCATALLSLVLLGVVGENGYLERRARRQQIQAMTAEIEKVKQENQQLSQSVRDLRSDPHAIEKLARERLPLGRPGDIIVRLPHGQPQPTPPVSSPPR